jgi:hypothetical protein
MKKNLGNLDKLIRFFLAVNLGLLFVTGVVNGVLGIVFIALAVILLLTSLAGTCPLYSVLGLSSKSKKTKDE